MKYVALILLIVLIVIVWPFILVWSLNTMFELAIPYTLKTWFAAGVLSATVYGGKYK